jgi:hypothetical protein
MAGHESWTGGRVVEGTGLENRHTGNGIVSSNLTLSVKRKFYNLQRLKKRSASCNVFAVDSSGCAAGTGGRVV